MNGLLIIRPSLRRARWQLAGVIVASALLGLAIVLDGGFSLRGTWLGLAFSLPLAASVVLQGYLSHRQHRAVVVTPEYLGYTDARGRHHILPWVAVRDATHATGLLGMRWAIKTPTATILVRDLGIASERWGALWHHVVTAVGRRGRPVLVDQVSDALYD